MVRPDDPADAPPTSRELRPFLVRDPGLRPYQAAALVRISQK